LLLVFVQVEIAVGLVGGFSAAILFLLFEYVSTFRVVLYSLVGVTGILVGVEIPLLLRLLKDRFAFSELVARVFAVDYIGALLASILFPLVLVPQLGLIRTAFLFGLFNVLIAVWLLMLYAQELPWAGSMRTLAIAALLALAGGFVASDRITSITEQHSYEGEILHAQSSRYQRIVLTRNRDDIRLFLNGNLQFSSRDEYRYHEALVHPGLARLPQAKNILVLGGGDGLAVREILKYPSVQSVTLVDLDPAMVELFSKQPLLTALNHNAFSSPKVEVIHADAFIWLREQRAQNRQFDFIVVDFPDPGNFSLGKLYTQTFYNELQHVMHDDSIAVIQSTSPYFAPKSFWCVASTLQAAGLTTLPYHTYVASFGEWGYVMAAKPQHAAALLADHASYSLPPDLRYFTADEMANMQQFAADMKPQEAVVANRLDNQQLVQYFESEWAAVGSNH
jgi:spermidine synthase